MFRVIVRRAGAASQPVLASFWLVNRAGFVWAAMIRVDPKKPSSSQYALGAV